MASRNGTRQTKKMDTPKLLFATNNKHKIDEIQAAVGDQIQVIGLKDAGINIDIPEPHDTLEKKCF